MRLAALMLLWTLQPSDSTVHLQRGIEETSRGEFAKAMIDFQSARRLDASNPQVYFRMGLLFGRMADFHNAESAFRRALELKPSLAEAHYNLGLAQIANPQSKLDWPSAISSFRAALKHRPNYAEAANYLGSGLMATGDLDGAVTEFIRAIQLNPDLAEAHFNLGLAMKDKNRMDIAESEFRRAQSIRQAYPEAITALAKLLLKEGKLPEAEQELTTALRSNPDLSDAHYALAQVEQSEKKTAAAQLEFAQVGDLAQQKTDALQSARMTNEGLQDAARGEMAAALEAEKEAVLLKPDFGLPHYNLALILADSGDWDGAAQESIKAASLMQGNASPWFQLGRVLKQKKDLHGSYAALSWAACLNPTDSRIAAELTDVGTQVKRVEFDQLAGPPFGPASDTAAAHLSFAVELYAAGDHLGAVGELLRVLVLDPANVTARRQLATAYRKLNLIRKAELEQAKADLLVTR